ncbi:dactylin [Anaeramoeba ignava]|uniref:Dactylin n=1 Tax=Anaeramoeba ignava TaxID=1746090 RepID=A0A9Q0LAX2_ANAIG|nr:dactylin [Anaeramoeba ignava]
MNSSNLEERNSEQNDSFKLQIFKQKGVISISESNFQLLKKGKYLKSTEKHRISPKEENLIINQLHPEILFMICEYLSPGAFTRLGITCKYFQDIFNDQTTWRQIAKCYQNFFIFDYLEIKPFYLQDGLSILAFQTPINQEIEKIQIENQKLDFPNLDPTHFKKKNAERGIRLEKYSNNEKIDDSTKEDEFLHHMVPIKASTEEERIKYINLLENPKEEMLEKGRKIYQLFLERKKHWENEMINKKRKETLNNFQTKEIDFFSPILIILFSFGFSIYFILITLKKEDKIDTKLSYQSLSIMIPLFAFFIIQLIETIFMFLE